MYHHIRGTLSHSSPTLAVLETGGVGYELHISLSTHSDLPSVGQECMLLCHFAVSENAQSLFGFATEEERRLVRALIAISGVGPAKATMVLSSITPNEFIAAIEQEDLTRLKKIKGLGPKTAGRLIVELKGASALAGAGIAAASPGSPASTGIPAPATDLASAASQALQTLGLNPREADSRVEKILKAQPDLALEDLIRAALQ
ncbi:MAG: Holliday junction branch migration protein RuvA [Planctomycetota bacterium]|jgi:Holliday junction DNA helicase RuvA